jgi:hypothetical protein
MGRAAELGGSLLASKQRRDDKYRKEQESYEKKQALFSLIVPPLVKEASTWIQRSNIKGFDRNENLIKENRDTAQAYASAQNWMTIDKAIQEQGGSAFDYYANLNRPEAERRAAEALRTEDMNIYVGKHGPYQAQITELVDEWAEDQAVEYETAMGHLRKIGTPDEYKSLVELARSEARSDDIFGTLFQKAKNFATRTSQEEIDNRAIESIANSALGKNIDAFNLFQEEYKRTRDVMKAKDFTLFATNLKVTDKNKENEMLWTEEDRDFNVHVVEGVLMYRGESTWAALNDPAVKRTVNLDENAIDFNKYGAAENADKLARDIAREVYDKANFHTLAFSQFTTQGFEAFSRTVEEKLGMDMIAAEASDDIVDHLIVVGDIYQQIKQNPKFIKNEIIEGGVEAMFSTVVDDMQEMFLELESMRMQRETEGGEARYKAAVERLQNMSEIKIQSISDGYASLNESDFLFTPRANR